MSDDRDELERIRAQAVAAMPVVVGAPDEIEPSSWRPTSPPGVDEFILNERCLPGDGTPASTRWTGSSKLRAGSPDAKVRATEERGRPASRAEKGST